MRSVPRPVKEKPKTLGFEVEKIREDFPILKKTVNNKPLVYADNAATTQKPFCVIERLANFYSEENANVHRGVHTLSEQATETFENSRKTVQNFLNAAEKEEIIFTRGTTESINLVAHSYGVKELRAGEEILISTLEHHSNIVPWQIVCQLTGAKLKVIPVSDSGELNVDAYKKLIGENTKLVAISHISNALGTINPIRQMTKIAKEVGATVLIDGAQGAIHTEIDVQSIGCDFYAFSGHKALGPTGIGVLYGRREILDKMSPWQSGGDMIRTVSFEKTTYNDVPYKFEAGTPNISGAIGLATAIQYFESLDLQMIISHEKQLLERAVERAKTIRDLRLVGTAKNKSAICSFLVEKIHPNDLGTLLDQQGVAIRTGHHCAMPLMSRLQVPGTVRASFAFYNSLDDVDSVFNAIEIAAKILSD
ncbi:MAG: cysteine desulfurase [Pseudomonadota bacterium]|nr:cysteine desulfurase [Pseudomonadota bacterium]